MGYFDENDPLEEYLRTQSAGARRSLAFADPLPKQSGPPAYKDPALQPEEGTDWGGALANYGIPAIAGLIDAATNRGRGIGTILQSAGVQANQRAIGKRELAAEKLKFLTDDADAQQKAKYYDYLNRSLGVREDQGGKRIANQTEGLGLRKEAQDFALNPNNPQAQAGAAKVKELTGTDLEGLNARQQGQAMPIVGRIQGAALAPVTAGKSKQAVIDTEVGNAPRTNQVAADKAGAEADARVRATTGAERDINSATPVANAEIADPAVWGALNDAQRTKGMAASEARAVFEKSLTTMREINKRTGLQNLPSGDKATYDAAHGTAVSQLSNLYNTGVISKEEYQRMSDRLPQSGGIKSSAHAAVGWATNNDNLLADELEGAGNEILGELGVKMSTYGLRPKSGAGKPKQRPPLEPAAVAAPGDRLPVAGGRSVASTPPIPAQPGGGQPYQQQPAGWETKVTSDRYAGMRATQQPDGSYTITDGKRTKPIRREQLQMFLAGGGQL